ncbi:MAG: DUF6580 family putative transport protein [Candidatus Nealsonbacteria bacterium]
MKITALFKEKRNIEILFALIFILIGISLRFLPHPPNFSPIAAIALFGGVYLSRKIAFIIPVAILIISDIFIGYYEFILMASVYGSFLLVVALGFWLKKHKKWYYVLGGAFFSSLLFFVITNFAMWAFTPWYDKTMAGFIQCYLMALPFFKNTLLGDLVFVPIFFGTYELVTALVKSKLSSLQRSLV